jgi:hypothetical protein
MLKNDLVRLRHILDAAREAVKYSQNHTRRKDIFLIRQKVELVSKALAFIPLQAIPIVGP